MFIPYEIVVLLILSPFLVLLRIVVWIAVRLFRLALFFGKWMAKLSYRMLCWTASKLVTGLAWLWRRYAVQRSNL